MKAKKRKTQGKETEYLKAKKNPRKGDRIFESKEKPKERRQNI